VSAIGGKLRFWGVAAIGAAIVLVDFTSWILSAATELVMVAAILWILSPMRTDRWE